MAGPERELLVLRHAKAERGEMADFDRGLTRRGRRDAQRMGRLLVEQALLPDLLVSSPARRALETADLAAEAMGLPRDRLRFEPRVYEGDGERLLAVVADCPAACRRVLLIGHNPGAEALVRRLARTLTEPADGKFFPTAALARLRVPSEWREVRAGTADLVAIVRPRDLGR
jgi:phosphohistidine phosphatase